VVQLPGIADQGRVLSGPLA